MGWGGGVPKCVMAPAQVCQAQFPGRLQGLRPSGKGRVKSAFQQPEKKGGGGGEREEEKQTRSVCRRHKARYTKGARQGRRGLPGARLIPTPARGLGEECGPRIPSLGPVGESFSHPGCLRSAGAPLPEGGPGKPPQRGKEGLDVRGRYALSPLRSAIHPRASPERLPEAQPAAPEAPRPTLGVPRADHTGADHVQPPALRFHGATSRRVLPPLGAWPGSSSAPRDSKVPSASPKPARHGSEATQGSQQSCA